MQNSKYSIFCEDSIEFLEKYSNKRFSAVITDPPAGIGLFGKDWDNPKQYKSFTKNTKEREAFVCFLESVFTQCFNNTTDDATMVAWTLPKTSHWTARALLNSGWHIYEEFYHVFATGMPKSLNISSKIEKLTADPELVKLWKGRGTGLKPAYEKWLVASKKKPEKVSYDYGYFKKIGRSERKIGNTINNHPSVKSLELMQRLVTQYTNPGDLVLDPFMGSGSTGIACYKLDRFFCGIEKEKKSFEISKKRFETLDYIEEIEFL